MVGYKLTQQQKDDIHLKYYSDSKFINCLKYINNNWFTFLTEEDKLVINETEYSWILDCEEIEYISPNIISSLNIIINNKS